MLCDALLLVARLFVVDALVRVRSPPNAAFLALLEFAAVSLAPI